MPLFVVHRLDLPGTGSLREKWRGPHLEYLAGFQDSILAAGPYMDPETGEDRGSMFLTTFPDFEHARRFAEDDPFTIAGIFAETQVWPWTQRVGSLPTAASTQTEG